MEPTPAESRSRVPRNCWHSPLQRPPISAAGTTSRCGSHPPSEFRVMCDFAPACGDKHGPRPCVSFGDRSPPDLNLCHNTGPSWWSPTHRQRSQGGERSSGAVLQPGPAVLTNNLASDLRRRICTGAAGLYGGSRAPVWRHCSSIPTQAL